MADEADTVLSSDEIELIVKALEAWAGPAEASPDIDTHSADEQGDSRSEAHRLAELLTTHTVTLTPAAQP